MVSEEMELEVLQPSRLCHCEGLQHQDWAVSVICLYPLVSLGQPFRLKLTAATRPSDLVHNIYRVHENSRKEKRIEDCAFRRQFNEKPSIIMGCRA